MHHEHLEIFGRRLRALQSRLELKTARGIGYRLTDPDADSHIVL